MPHYMKKSVLYNSTFTTLNWTLEVHKCYIESPTVSLFDLSSVLMYGRKQGLDKNPNHMLEVSF